MTRRPFGGTTADFVEQVRADNSLQADVGATCTFYTARTGGTQILDLQDLSGNAITSVSADGFGAVPPFMGPNDGTALMWVSAGGTARQAMLATDTPNRLSALEAIATASMTVVGPKTANYTAAPYEFVRWDTTTGSFTQTLPTAPANGTVIGAKIVILGTGNTVTLHTGGSDVFNKTGGGTTLVLSLLDQAYEVEYFNGIWTVVGADLTLSQLDLRYDALGAAAAGSAFNLVGPKTASYTAAAGDFALWDTTAASYVMTLPTAPTDKTGIGAQIVTLGAGHTVTLTCGGSDVFNKAGGPTTYVLSVLNQGVELEYQHSTGVWVVVGSDLTLAQLDARYDATGAATTAAAAAQAAAISTAEGASAQRSSNLSDLASASTARTNLGLGSAATHANTDFAQNPESVNTVSTSGSAQTIPDPVTAQSISRITLTAACTLTFPSVAAGKSFTLVLIQDGTGSRTVTWPGTVKWAGAVAPTLSTGVGKIDVLSFVCIDGTNWYGFVAGQDMR